MNNFLTLLIANSRIFFTKLIGVKNTIRILYFLKNGKIFNTKFKEVSYNYEINLRKFSYNNLLFPIITNKYLVREYVANTIGEQYLVPLLNVFSKPKDFLNSKLSYPCIIKTSSGSGSRNFLILNSLNEKKDFPLKKALTNEFYIDYGYSFCETWYSKTSKYIIVEKLLEFDYQRDYEIKVYIFNHKNYSDFIFRVIKDRTLNKTSSFYDQNWNFLNITYNNGKSHNPIDKPLFLDEIKNLSIKLTKGINFARVDFMIVNSKIYFREITLADTSGYIKFSPSSFDHYFGSLIFD